MASAISAGRYGALEWLEELADSTDRFITDDDVRRLREWAQARAGEEEAAKAARNAAEAEAIRLLDLVHELAAKVDPADPVHARVTEAGRPEARGPIHRALAAAVELTKTASDPRWAREPFQVLQVLAARLVDLEAALREAGRIQAPPEGLRLVR